MDFWDRSRDLNVNERWVQFFSVKEPVDYETAYELQKRLVEDRIAESIPDTILFLEHRPVITRGRGLQKTKEERPKKMPLLAVPEGVKYVEVERGGDLTCHEPGQLVVYPIVKLDGHGMGPDKDVIRFVRFLEAWVIELLKQFTVDAKVIEDSTGVWVSDKKIASIGIAVKEWVTYHGFALNVINDLKVFQSISPCGFESNVMTNLKSCKRMSNRNEIEDGLWRARLEDRLIHLIDERFNPIKTTHSEISPEA